MVSLSLEITIHQESESKPFSGIKSDEAEDGSTTLLVTSSIRITAAAATSTPKWAAVFLPSSLNEAGFLHNLRHDSISSIARVKAARSKELSQNLLAMIHPFLAENFHIQAICCLRGARHTPADLVLLSLFNVGQGMVEEMIETTICETIRVAPESTLKVLLINDVAFVHDGEAGVTSNVASLSPQTFDIPTCPVCLHRLEPFRIGLPKPRSSHLCSKFCNSSLNVSQQVNCPLQRLLLPWPEPSQCMACQVVQAYWDEHCSADLFCYECAMQETLWTCLTCGFVGCGRYSNKHAAQHFRETGHPFSLELATLRIWSYADGEFAHRTDLLDCPSSPPLCRPWQSRDTQRPGSLDPMYDATAQPEKHPKKATMIGEEYEALLQSALEDQAQHYEGEISRLHAELTAEQVDNNSLNADEIREIAMVREEIDSLRSSMEHIGHELLGLQAQEAGNRATSQRLLHEQQAVQVALKTMQAESKQERERGQLQVEELEQQISDLTANQKMKQQFLQSGELANAQIWGTSGEEPTARQGKKGKKFRRGHGRR